MKYIHGATYELEITKCNKPKKLTYTKKGKFYIVGKNYKFFIDEDDIRITSVKLIAIPEICNCKSKNKKPVERNTIKASALLIPTDNQEAVTIKFTRKKDQKINSSYTAQIEIIQGVPSYKNNLDRMRDEIFMEDRKKDIITFLDKAIVLRNSIGDHSELLLETYRIVKSINAYTSHAVQNANIKVLNHILNCEDVYFDIYQSLITKDVNKITLQEGLDELREASGKITSLSNTGVSVIDKLRFDVESIELKTKILAFLTKSELNKKKLLEASQNIYVDMSELSSHINQLHHGVNHEKKDVVEFELSQHKKLMTKMRKVKRKNLESYIK